LNQARDSLQVLVLVAIFQIENFAEVRTGCCYGEARQKLLGKKEPEMDWGLGTKAVSSAVIRAKAGTQVDSGFRRGDEARASTLGLRIQIRTEMGWPNATRGRRKGLSTSDPPRELSAANFGKRGVSG